MTLYALAEEALMIPFDFSHHEQAVDHLIAAALDRIFCRELVFHDVGSFQFPGPVHRCEPATNVTEQSDRFSDDPEDGLAYEVRSGIELAEQLSHQSPVMPFLALDNPDPISLGRIGHALCVSPVSKAGGKFPRAGTLKLTDELVTSFVFDVHRPSL